MAKKKSTPPKKELDPRMIEIGEKLTALRIAAGYTNYENFAWDKDIGRMQYWRMEKGSNFTFASLFKVLDAHGISMADFFSEFTDVGITKEKKE